MPTQGKDAIMAQRDHLGSGGKRAPTMSLAQLRHQHGRAISISLALLPASLPGMWDRTVIIGSAGKTFSVTGWKVSSPCNTSLPPHPCPFALGHTGHSTEDNCTLNFEPQFLKIPILYNSPVWKVLPKLEEAPNLTTFLLLSRP